MSKSYKPISNKYIAIDALRYSKTVPLKSKIDGMNTSITNNTNTLSPIGTLINTGNEITSNATQGQSNNICSLNIPAGTWLVIGKWRYEGNDVSSYTALENISVTLPDSVYDNNGWVNRTVIGIQQSSTSSTIWMNLWPRNKTISVKTQIWAMRIK